MYLAAVLLLNIVASHSYTFGNAIQHFVAVANSRPHPNPLRPERPIQHTAKAYTMLSSSKQPVCNHKAYTLGIPMYEGTLHSYQRMMRTVRLIVLFFIMKAEMLRASA